MIKIIKLVSITILLLMSGKSKIANAQGYTYGIVFSSNSDIQDAQYEIEQLDSNLPEYSSLAGIFKKGDDFHSVILFRDETEALQNFNTVRDFYESIELLTDIWDLERKCSEWLQHANTEQKIRYYDCSSKIKS